MFFMYFYSALDDMEIETQLRNCD